MKRIRVVADKNIPFLDTYLSQYCDISYLSGEEISQEKLRQTDALIVRSVTQCDAHLLHNTEVQIIISATIGDDHIDKRYCEAHHIQWRTASGCNKMAVVQYVIMALFNLDYRYPQNWMTKTIGIIGLGNIGSLLNQVLTDLGVKTLLNDPPRAEKEGHTGFVSLKTISEEADIISIHVPRIQEGKFKTVHLLDEDFFSTRTKKVSIINTSRGEVLSGELLKKWKSIGTLERLVLDVWENEPNIDTDLLQIVDLGTPHIAGYSLQGKKNASYQSLRHFEDFFNITFQGLKNIINPIPKQNIQYQCQSDDSKNCIWNILKPIWDIEQDSKLLISQSKKFRSIRKNYIFRPQISEFGIELANCNKKIISIINIVSSENTGI